PACARGADGCAAAEVFRVSSDFSVFAALFVLALAIERVLQPVSRFIGPDTDAAKDKRDDAEAQVKNDPDDASKVLGLAQAKAEVDQSRQIGAILHWGVAIALGFVLAAKLNVLLLAAISASDAARPDPWVDLLV